MKKTSLWDWIGFWCCGLLPGMATLLMSLDARANPQGMTVVSGKASAQQSGNTLNIVTSQNTYLQWNSFNIGSGETTVFQQPSSTSIVWNRIGDQNPSTIYGSLQANGLVVLANPYGFYFGPDSFVKAAGLVVTTSPISPPVGSDPGWTCNCAPTSKPIINYGRLETTSGGSLFLISKQIENHGTIDAPGGTVGLLGGDEVLLSERPDGKGLSARVHRPKGSVVNQGIITADAGNLLIEAQTVNQGGLVQADSIREKYGVIELYASDEVNLDPGSSITAQGDNSGNSPGGRITIKSDGRFVDNAGSKISAAGGLQGGDGGSIDICAPSIGAIASTLDAKAAAGSKNGELLIDPADIVLSYGGTDTLPADGTVNPGDPPDTLSLNVNNAFSGFSSITLQATHDITLNQFVTWDLHSSTGLDNAGCQLRLQAGNDISMGSGSGIYGGDNWAVSMNAGRDINLKGAVVQTGLGNINLNAARNVSILPVLVPSVTGDVEAGAIRTINGGSISVRAETGSVDCGSTAGLSLGTMPSGYDFTQTGYTVDANVGGIATAAGGDVDIWAGANIKAYLPPRYGGNPTGDPGSGAFGPQPGNVTLTAGGNITGHFIEANGAGIIKAGANAGVVNGTPLALSLVNGSWAVAAADSINLQEVRNPNGSFNTAKPPKGGFSYQYYFDYDPSASVLLDAGNKVVLSGLNLPHLCSFPIYPSSLVVEAGKGGVEIDSDLTLFPSATGNLMITTTDGGNLTTRDTATFHNVTISDSSSIRWTGSTTSPTFTQNDHGAALLHLNDPNPTVIDVSGSIDGMIFYSPKPLQMTANGDIRDTSFKAINFKPSDKTTVTAGRSISYQSDWVFVTLVSDPLMNLLLTSQDAVIQRVLGSLRYDASTKTLWFQHKMTADELQKLQNLDFIVNATDLQSLQTLYNLSQSASIEPQLGMSVLGPGFLQIKAPSIDLGSINGVIARGIDTSGSGLPNSVAHQLGSLTSTGAEIDIQTSGSLSLLSTTIESEYGGNININCGSLDVGSKANLGGGDYPRGIISLWNGNINVDCVGNVELNGSRIASYDGGNINILSETGEVDAGQGGLGFIVVSKPYIDPATHQFGVSKAYVGGSGVLALSYPDPIPGQPLSHMGNITVTTPLGNILASSGGIVQVPYGKVSSRHATIVLTAGSTDSDGTEHIGSIYAEDSGVVGSDITLKATGDIKGLVVAQENINIKSQHNVDVTAVAQGNVNISASGTVTGTIVGGGIVDVAGTDITAALVGGTVNATGNLSGEAAPAAPVTPTGPEEGAQNANKTASSATQTLTSDDSDDEKKKKGRPVVAEYVGRVTVLLPK